MSLGSVDALLMCGGKHLYYFEANVFRIIFTNFCQNRLDFADDVIKTFWFDFLPFGVPVDVHLLNVNAKFDKVV